MADHKYQLVFQFAAVNEAEYTGLIRLMLELEESLGTRSDLVVDGHDSGLGEFNIFIHTDKPLKHFGVIGEIVENLRPELLFSAGYRTFEEDAYIPLYPRDSTTFKVA